MSSSKEATRAVSLGASKTGAVCQPSPTFGIPSKLTSVAALQLALGRKNCKLSGGQSLEHLKTGEDRPVKNDQHSGEEGLAWWEVTPTHVKYVKYTTYLSNTSNPSDISNR